VIALRYSKKGQIGMMEMFMVIFVLFIIIGLGMYYFYKFSFSNQQETAEDSCVQSTNEQLSSVLQMPEIKCSNYANDEECIDIVKLIAFKDEPSIETLSRGSCKKSIIFKQIYPSIDERYKDVECGEQEFRDPNFPNNCAIWNLFQPLEADIKNKNTQIILETPVSLYFPTLNQYRIGRLELKIYQK
jgi:hypothetical protein